MSLHGWPALSWTNIQLMGVGGGQCWCPSQVSFSKIFKENIVLSSGDSAIHQRNWVATCIVIHGGTAVCWVPPLGCNMKRTCLRSVLLQIFSLNSVKLQPLISIFGKVEDQIKWSYNKKSGKSECGTFYKTWALQEVSAIKKKSWVTVLEQQRLKKHNNQMQCMNVDCIPTLRKSCRRNS